MINEILDARISDYSPTNELEQENVLQEIVQHYILASLARSGLFSEAIFHGGTCLRIFHGMSRFSEDLDFILKEPDRDFRWAKHVARAQADCALEGLHFEIQDRSEADDSVKKAFLKTDSIGKVLVLELPFHRHARRKIRVKLEIDTNPPAGSGYETGYITFPNAAAITTQPLQSGFAMKCHALLCRRYAKGRDWYDLAWYASKHVVPDLPLLANALHQQGPWAEERITVTPKWLVQQLQSRIRGLDWNAVRDDVRRFVPTREQRDLDLWSTDFFLYQAEQIAKQFDEADRE